MRAEQNNDASPHTRDLGNSQSHAPTTSPLKAPPSALNGSSSSAGPESYTNGHSERPSGPFFGHDREEITRILIQSLTDLGYQNAANLLSRESGYELEVPSVAAFRIAIQAGDWSEAEALLFGRRQHERGGLGTSNGFSAASFSKAQNSTSSQQTDGLPLAETANQSEMLFHMRQQKYLELLEEGDLGSALAVLRQELAPLHQDTVKLHALSSLMMCSSAEELRAQASWDGAAGNSRIQLLSELSKSISPSVMIPEHRLAVLLDQVQERQIQQCLYHNTTSAPSLYHDHHCDPDDFPLEVLTELREHSDEVWYVEFSHDGTMLASAGRDNSVVIYDTRRWHAMFRLADHHGGATGEIGVCYISWSPDDKYLLSCSQAKDLVVYDTRNGHRVGSIDHFSYPVTTAAWAPDGQSFVVGSQDSQKPLGLYRLSDQELIHTWASNVSDEPGALRIDDCSISADGSKLAAITHENSVTRDSWILVYDFETRLKLAEWKMEDRLTSITLSHDGSTLLVSMNEGRLMLLDSETGEVVQRYSGLKQSSFVIRSTFGGAGENFVISGSEDSHVYIWRKQSGQQVAALEAHSPGTVNCVAWHPTDPTIFASAGDDRRVRIWSNSRACYLRAEQLGIRGLGA